MDKASKVLEDITIPKKWLPTGYYKLSLDLPLVDKVIDPVSPSVYPTLPMESEIKVVDSMSYPPNPTLSLESVTTKVFTLTQSSSCPSILVKSELKPIEVFVFSLDCSMQGEILSISIEPSPGIEIIFFDWSNLTTSCIHLSVPFKICVSYR